MGPEYELTTFNIYLTARKWWVGEEPGLNKNTRNWLLQLRLHSQRFERVTKEVNTPPAR